MSQVTAKRMYLHMSGIDIDDFRVGHQFNYQQDNFMTPTMTGHLDSVITKVIVQGDLAEGVLTDYAKEVLRMCFAGEGVQNATEMHSNVYLNGSVVKWFSTYRYCWITLMIQQTEEYRTLNLNRTEKYYKEVEEEKDAEVALL